MKKAVLVFALALAACSHKPTVIGLSCTGLHTKNSNGQETKINDTTHYVVDLPEKKIFRLSDDGIRSNFCTEGRTCKISIDDNSINGSSDGPFFIAGPTATAHTKLVIDRVSGDYLAVLTIIDSQRNDSYVETKSGVCEVEPVAPEPTEHKF